jgi:hypothetical protein
MTVSRRSLVAGAGAAVTAGAAAPAEAATARTGLAPESRDALLVIGTLVQEGLEMTGFGWLTHVAGIADGDLFTDPGQPGATTARLTWRAKVQVTARNVLPDLFSASGEGWLKVFFDSDGGAQAGDPASFGTGRLVARYDATVHNTLTVIGPNKAVTEIDGELLQVYARAFTLDGRSRVIGRSGLKNRLEASGPGTRSEPTIPRATFHVAGGVHVPA